MDTNLHQKTEELIENTLKTCEAFKKYRYRYLFDIQENEQVRTLLIYAGEIILSIQPDPTNPYSSFNPMVQLNLLRLLKDGLDTGDRNFLSLFMKSDIPKFLEQNYACFDHENLFDDRGAYLFSSTPNKGLKMMGNSMLRLALEMCYYLGKKYEYFNGSKSSIRISYENLIKKGVKFPNKVFYFRDSAYPNPFVGFQKDAEKLNPELFLRLLEENVIHKISENLDQAEQHYTVIKDYFFDEKNTFKKRQIVNDSTKYLTQYFQTISSEDKQLLEQKVGRNQIKKKFLMQDIEDMKKDAQKIVEIVEWHQKKLIQFSEVKELIVDVVQQKDETCDMAL